MSAAASPFTIRAADGVELRVGAHPADGGGPVVVLVHGIASHMGWYRPLADALAAEGVSVYLPDRRGSGLSGGERGHMPAWRTLVEDLLRVLDAVSERHPGRSISLLGISLGAVVATATALLHPERIDRLALLAPGFASKIRVPLVRRLRVLRRAFVSPTKLYDLPFGVDALTSLPAWQAALAADSLRTTRVSARFLVEMFKLQRRTLKRLPSLRNPLLVLLAGDDAIIDNPPILRSLSRLPPALLHAEIWEGASHLLPASRPRKDLLARLVPWFRREGLPSNRGVVEVPRFEGSAADLPAPPNLPPTGFGAAT